jgi:DNA-binding LytR/AlgR family response regulator
MVATLYALGLPTGVAHAGFATALDIAFSPAAEPEDWVRLLLGRTPMDMLVYLALATFAAALVAQQRGAEASAHSAELSRTLDSARAALSARAAGPEPAPRLLVSTGSKQIVVEPGEVEWFASAGNYVVVNWAGREGLIRETLTAVEARLDPAVFARSHRSTIVNLARVRETASLSDGSWRLTVESGAELVVSRTYRDAVLARLRG